MAPRRIKISEGGSGPQMGLWAVLQPGCARPTSSAVHTWPECATPVWLQPGQATTIVQSPVRSEFVVGTGTPRLAQVTHENEAGERRYRYFAFRTLDAAPHRSALVWVVFCDPERTPPQDAEAECLVDSEDELRRLARIAVSRGEAGRAEHMGPG